MKTSEMIGQQEKNDRLMQQEMELQLHEQYASNSNATLTSMLTLFVFMLAVVGGYGHVFISSQTDCESGFLMKVSDLYTVHALLVTTIAATLVLAAVAYICIETGYKGRMEQFIIHAIRMRYYCKKSFNNLFPKRYTPFDKCSTWVRPMQSPYDTFLYIIFFTMLIINFASAFRVLHCICHCECICSLIGLMYLQILTIIVFLVVVIFGLAYWYGKYSNRCCEYRSKGCKRRKSKRKATVSNSSTTNSACSQTTQSN